MRTIGAMDLNIAQTPSLARRAVDHGLPIDPITTQRLIAANAECMRVLVGILQPIGRGVSARGDMMPLSQRTHEMQPSRVQNRGTFANLLPVAPPGDAATHARAAGKCGDTYSYGNASLSGIRPLRDAVCLLPVDHDGRCRGEELT